MLLVCLNPETSSVDLESRIFKDMNGHKEKRVLRARETMNNWNL